MLVVIFCRFRHRHFGTDRYDALTDAEGTDDWLEHQLDKLRFRRDMDPDMQRRKKQEKLLLEVGFFDKFGAQSAC